MSRISKSLNGDKVLFIAREGKRVVARAETLDKLELLLENRAAANAAPLPVEEVREEEDERPEKPSRKLRFRKSEE